VIFTLANGKRMNNINECPPLMVLAEESENHQLFRFRGKRWALITCILGIILIAGAIYLNIGRKPEILLLVSLYGFGLLLLYSTLYSLTADQWLVFDGIQLSVKFRKKNLYGNVEWQRPGGEFKEIRVFRNFQEDSRNMNWTIMLVGHDGMQLFLGENEFGSFSRERALIVAGKAGRLAGINVIEA
jgi:hypothetical protein